MKVVVIEKISRFVQWPEEEKVIDVSQRFIIGILGQHPVAERAREFYAGRLIKEKIVEIRNLSSLEDVADCHLVYVTRSCQHNLSMILEETDKKPVLTIGDSPGYAEKGILVNLYVAGNKLRFEINEKGFHKAGLEIEPILLKVAKIVNPLENIK